MVAPVLVRVGVPPVSVRVFPVREKVRLGVGGGVIVVEPVRDLLVSLVEYDSDGVGGGEIVADGVG